MDILDYEETVRIAGPDGTRVSAALNAMVEPGSIAETELGNSEHSLAYQKWLEVRLTTATPLAFDEGTLVFADGSRRVASFTPQKDAAKQHSYKVSFSPEQPGEQRL
jgi:hypothetical protein